MTMNELSRMMISAAAPHRPMREHDVPRAERDPIPVDHPVAAPLRQAQLPWVRSRGRMARPSHWSRADDAAVSLVEGG